MSSITNGNVTISPVSGYAVGLGTLPPEEVRLQLNVERQLIHSINPPPGRGIDVMFLFNGRGAGAGANGNNIYAHKSVLLGSSNSSLFWIQKLSKSKPQETLIIEIPAEIQTTPESVDKVMSYMYGIPLDQLGITGGEDMESFLNALKYFKMVHQLLPELFKLVGFWDLEIEYIYSLCEPYLRRCVTHQILSSWYLCVKASRTDMSQFDEDTTFMGKMIEPRSNLGFDDPVSGAGEPNGQGVIEEADTGEEMDDSDSGNLDGDSVANGDDDREVAQPQPQEQQNLVDLCNKTEVLIREIEEWKAKAATMNDELVKTNEANKELEETIKQLNETVTSQKIQIENSEVKNGKLAQEIDGNKLTIVRLTQELEESKQHCSTHQAKLEEQGKKIFELESQMGIPFFPASFRIEIAERRSPNQTHLEKLSDDGPDSFGFDEPDDNAMSGPTVLGTEQREEDDQVQLGAELEGADYKSGISDSNEFQMDDNDSDEFNPTESDLKESDTDSEPEALGPRAHCPREEKRGPKESGIPDQQHSVRSKPKQNLVRVERLQPPATFARKSNQRLVDHNRTDSRDGEKLYKCHECEKLFKQRTSLWRHKFTHMPQNEWPYKCKICDKSFYCSTNLRYHHMVHIGKKPYACHICPETFIKKQQLEWHSFKTNSHKKKVDCPNSS